jgi:hypothetical protein
MPRLAPVTTAVVFVSCRSMDALLSWQ